VPDFRSVTKFFGIFGAGVVTAGYFLSSPIEKPALLQRAPDFRQESADAGWVLVPPLPYTQPLITPPLSNALAAQDGPGDKSERLNSHTTGSAAGEAREQIPNKTGERERETPSVGQAEPTCNYSLCRRYRSFDEATCTFQPYRGPRETCTR
jgi:hypothetical protein